MVLSAQIFFLSFYTIGKFNVKFEFGYEISSANVKCLKPWTLHNQNYIEVNALLPCIAGGWTQMAHIFLKCFLQLYECIQATETIWNCLWIHWAKI